MQRTIANERMPAETAGLWYGLLGVLSFSLTLPATRVAVAYLDPSVVGLGRALVAALVAAALLAATRQRWPTRAEWRSLAIVACGVVLGFPFLSAWALRSVPAAHGAIVIGLLPLATALVATLRGGERPSRLFWLASLAGSAAVVSFALASGAGGLTPADLALLGAVAAGAVGYAEGGRLARSLGGWQVICWALILAAPFISLPVGLALWQHGAAAPPLAWLCFAYVALVSQLLGFFAWYHGLALGGVARVSQLQLLQPFFTLAASALLLGEHVTPATLAVALVVMAAVALGRRAPVRRS
ncbi:DMT family transporter [Kouleothrix sp.]|uniref:DMT family transporter n=1 Tax=Kouleothrix sp. TaxID=2779161 RepID=UPI00391B32D4